MDNYEINILRRDGDWKKVKPDDLILDSVEKKDDLKKEITKSEEVKSNEDFLYYLNEVNSIINKLEDLENNKTKLKDLLKVYELELMNKKKDTEDKMKSLVQKKEMFEKTISVIKNLRKF